jgi:hypothetical protein
MSLLTIAPVLPRFSSTISSSRRLVARRAAYLKADN